MKISFELSGYFAQRMLDLAQERATATQQPTDPSGTVHDLLTDLLLEDAIAHGHDPRQHVH